MVGDLNDHKISYVQNFSSVQNFRSLGAVESYNSYNGIGRELGTFCELSRVASQLKTMYNQRILNFLLIESKVSLHKKNTEKYGLLLHRGGSTPQPYHFRFFPKRKNFYCLKMIYML